jgi:PAS domain S-box-containing protein
VSVDSISGEETPPPPDKKPIATLDRVESGGELYRLLVESVRDYAIFALDPGGNIVTWNPGAERFKGYKADEIIGKHFSIFYPAEDKARQKPQLGLKEAERVGAFEDEGWRLRKDGSRFWANVVITALRDKSGKLVGFAKVTRDLTERREAEEQLRLSEQQFRLLVEAVRDYGIIMLDADGRIASWNGGAATIFGYPQEDIVGRHFSAFYPEDAVATGKPAYELEQAAATGRFEDEGWRIRKNGSSFWANSVITAVRDATGALLGFAKITRDLTERKAAEARAITDAKLVAQSEAASLAKSEFLAAMSHELRTPLNAIGGYVDLLALGIKGALTDQQQEYLDRIRRSQKHLLAIISDLLNFSRIEAGQINYDIRPVSVREVFDSVGAMMVPQALAKSVDFQWQYVSNELHVFADRSRLEQILLNLLTNAVKFTDEGGQVRMTSSPTNDHVRLDVTDTGIGIPVDNLSTIFEPFVQVGRSLTSNTEGTGLGLAISRDLAHAMQAELTVQSTLGNGSTFTLTFPRSRSATPLYDS